MLENPMFLKPDFGGTRYNVGLELHPDRLVFRRTHGPLTLKVTVPGEDAFTVISQEGLHGRFLEAGYDDRGDLSYASLRLVRYCEYLGLKETPGEEVSRKLKILKETGTEILVEADMVLGEIVFIQEGVCQAEAELPHDDEEQPYEIKPILNRKDDFWLEFTAQIIDDVLTLGFPFDEKDGNFQDFSLKLNLERLSSQSTPADIKKLLESAFVKA